MKKVSVPLKCLILGDRFSMDLVREEGFFPCDLCTYLDLRGD